MSGPGELQARVAVASRGTAAALALLDRADDERLRFWEVLKGITTPADFKVVRVAGPAGGTHVG